MGTLDFGAVATPDGWRRLKTRGKDRRKDW